MCYHWLMTIFGKSKVWISPKLQQFIDQGHRKISRATGLMVNEIAWDMRGEMISAIDRHMIVRKPAFVKSSFYRKPARIGSSNPVAVVGSIHKGGFHGWQAQQFGTRVQRDRVPTLVSRRKNKRKVVTRGVRFLPGRDFPTATEIVGRSDANAVIALMRILARRGDKRPFIIGKNEHPRFRGGLYQMRGRKDRRHMKARLELLQSFEGHKDQPRPVDWVGSAWKAYWRTHSARAEFRKAMNKVGLRDALRGF